MSVFASKHLPSSLSFCVQGYTGLDGRKGENGGAGAKVRRAPNEYFISCRNLVYLVCILMSAY